MRRTASSESPVSSAGRRYRLRSLFFFSGMLFLVLLAMSVVFYQSNRAFLLDYIREINARQAQSYARLLDTVFYRASYASIAIADNVRVQNYVAEASAADVAVSEFEAAIVDLLQMFTRTVPEIGSIYVYSQARDRIVSDRFGVSRWRFHDRDWFTDLERAEPGYPLLVYREDPVFGSPMVTLVRRLEEAGQLSGAVLINLDVEQMRRLVERGMHISSRRIYAVQSGGVVVFSTNDRDLGRPPDMSLEPLFLATAPGALFNLEYYLYDGSELLNEKSARLRNHLLVMIASILLVGAGLSTVFASFAYQPIRDIVDTIQHPDRHTTRLGPGGSDEPMVDEVQYIEHAIVRLMASNRQLEERLAERFHSLTRAHYAALQLQLNPHFLYNTLESIYWNCLEAFDTENPVPKSILALSQFLRMVIATDTMAVALAEEVRITDQYLTILQSRHENQLDVHWLIPHELESMSVPKLVLQPLVENAFYHGIKPLRRRGTIRIVASLKGPSLFLEVEDDGAGIRPDRLSEIESALSDDGYSARNGIGLSNVAQRLRILYDRGSRLEIRNGEQAGVTVTVVVPSERLGVLDHKSVTPM